MYFKSIQFGDERDPEKIEKFRLAWYECVECSAHWTEEDKYNIVDGGIWCPENCEITKQGKIVGDLPETDHRGYRWNKMVMPDFGWSRVAAEFLRCKSRPEQLMNFANSWLGEEWEENAETAGEVRLTTDDQNAPHELCQVPSWCQFLDGAIDVQKDHLWYSVYGFGSGEKIALIDEGKIEEQETGTEFDAAFQVLLAPGATYKRQDGVDMPVRALGIDGMHRQDEVHQFARRLPERIYVCIGANKRQTNPFLAKAIDGIPGRRNKRKTGLMMWTLDASYYKSLFARLTVQGKLSVPIGASGQWHNQIQSQRKVIERNARGEPIEKWIAKPGHKADHQFDCAYIATAIADILGYWRDPEKLQQQIDGPVIKRDYFKNQRARRKERKR
jgi:phage terminase large subunit GpA-like protein